MPRIHNFGPSKDHNTIIRWLRKFPVFHACTIMWQPKKKPVSQNRSLFMDYKRKFFFF